MENLIAIYGLNKLDSAETYSFKATDNWKGSFALVNPFPKDNELMEMRFRPNSFDGQFNYVNGKDKTIYGIQSFHHYRIDNHGKIKFKKKKSITFALPAIQYFFELPLRLKNAPFLKYAGVKILENQTYDLVFATWDQIEPHKEHDQYLLYIDRASGKLSFASYTVRGMYLPTPRNIYGSIRFEEINQNVNGISFPSKLYIQLNKIKKPPRALHTLTIDELRINNFPLSKLYPDKSIKFQGDAKF